jgi:hypothetical protein
MTNTTDIYPLQHHTSWIHHVGIHHIKSLLVDNGSRSMSYKSGIVVSVTLILESFEYVAFKVAFDYRMSTWKL